MRILIAEDSVVFRGVLVDALKKWGHDVIITKDGLQAWKALQQEDAPRLAILDWEMPGANGTEICAWLRERSKENLVIIGSSTGGPKALTAALATVPQLNASVILVQHMPKFINETLRKSLDKVCAMTVRMATHGTKLKVGNVYLAPSETHLVLSGSAILFEASPKVHSVRPSVDVAMKSLCAGIFENLVGVIMTGMGNDGAEGVSHIKSLGGNVISQTEETCSVYGMPKAADATGVVDCSLCPEDIGKKLASFVGVV